MAKVYTKNVYAADGRWEYDILLDGVTFIHQDFHPVESGQVPMDEAGANSNADAVIARLTAADMLPLLRLQLVGANAALALAISDSNAFGNPQEAQDLVAAAQAAVDSITAAIAASGG